MPRRTSLALAVLATACSAPRPEREPTGAPLEPAARETAVESAPAVAPQPQPVEARTDEVERAPAEVAGEPASAAQLPPQSSASAADEPKSAEAQAELDVVAQLERALAARDFALMRVLLDDALVVPLIAKARVLIERGRASEALVEADRALAQSPSEPRALVVHGEAALLVGVERRDSAMIERALNEFVQAGPSAAALFGASRAARALGRNEDALRYARDGWRAKETASEPQLESANTGESQARTLAEAAWAVWTDVREAGDGREEALFPEIEHALARDAEHAPRDPLAWSRWAELFRDTDRRSDERATLERAIRALPNETPLYETLARSFADAGDSAAALACFERLERDQPQSPLPWWFAARLRRELALASTSPDAVDALRTAEREFATCRARGGTTLGLPAREEALCRTAVGWRRLHAGDLVGALEAFRSTEQLFAGGLRVAQPPAVESGLDGIAAVALVYAKKSNVPDAATLYLELHSYDRTSLRWAQLAAEAQRMCGEAAKRVGDDCVLAGDRKINDARRLQDLRQRVQIDRDITSDAKLRSEFKRKSKHWLEGARLQFEASYLTYLEALALAPDDLRLLNDCAEVPIYFLRTNLDRAEQLLRRAVALGETRVADPALGAKEREELATAWGDAHKNLGKLYLELRNDPAQARTWFLRSVEIGPYPRADITESYLPRCEKLLSKH